MFRNPITIIRTLRNSSVDRIVKNLTKTVGRLEEAERLSMEARDAAQMAADKFARRAQEHGVEAFRAQRVRQNINKLLD